MNTHKEIFELPHKQSNQIDDIEDNFKYIKNKLGNIYLNPSNELSLIIMPDGTCFNALNDHATCAKWLNMNGIDIDQAIRFEASQQFYNFDFCSLNNFGFSEKSDTNEFIKITPEQAIVITDLYKGLSLGWKFMHPLEKSLEKATGFGFSKKDYKFGFGEQNLSTIAEYSKGYFDKYEYLKQRKIKAADHTPLD